ncbi:MAG: GGGtGRT protein [Thermoguttaceae bacterium]|nr:GGGtGRT protein [Thermoguttaceae bacterium]
MWVNSVCVEMMGFLGMGNNPMVGATVAVAVAVLILS